MGPMSAYLIDHPPRQRQFRDRGTTASGVLVIHTAENLPDWVGEDSGAEGVARFIQGRSDFGSYHFLADSDSLVHLIPLEKQAYGDGTGSNPHAIHISAATRTTAWSQMSRERRRGFLLNMARAAHRASSYVEKLHGVRIPARRVSRAESTDRKEGFISHAERDPSRRSDPGKDFPWDEFLDIYRELEEPTKPEPVELTRGKHVDAALRKVAGAVTELEEANAGDGPRGDKIRGALEDAVQLRRALRNIAFLNAEKKEE